MSERGDSKVDGVLNWFSLSSSAGWGFGYGEYGEY